MTDLYLIAGIIFAIVGSAGFSGTETVFLTLDRIRLQGRAAIGDRRVRKVVYFINNPERFVVSTLVGNNLVNVLYSSLVAVYLNRIGVSERVIFLLSPLVLLVFSESLPKAMARQFSDRAAPGAATMLYIFRLALLPLVKLVEISVAHFEKLFHVERQGVSISLTRSDFTFALTDAAAGGNVDHHETRWIKRLMNLSERTVSDVLTPRNRTASIKIDASTEEAIDLLAKTGHKRLVCFGKNEDDLLGIVRATDLLRNPPDLQSILKPVPIVPESLPLPRLVEWLRKQRTHFALAIDEYGGFAGIVTLNDLAAELVGAVRDRYSGEVKDCVRLRDRLWLVNGNARLSYLSETTGFEHPETRSNSIGGLLVELEQGIPSAGREFSVPGARLRVLKSDNHGVRLVRLALEEEGNSMRET